MSCEHDECGGERPEEIVCPDSCPGQGAEERCSRAHDEGETGAGLDAPYHGGRDYSGGESEEACHGEDTHRPGDEETRRCGLGRGEGCGDCGSGEGFHRLYGEGNTEYQTGEDVRQAAEDEGRREGDATACGEGQHQRQEGSEVAQCARELGERLAAEGGEVVVPCSPEIGCNCHGVLICANIQY